MMNLISQVRQTGKQVFDLRKDDAVVLSFASCGKCALCRGASSSYCKDLFKLNFAGESTSGKIAIKDKSGKPLNGMFFGQSSLSRLAIVNPSGAVKIEAKDKEELKKLVLGCGLQTGAGSIRMSILCELELKNMANEDSQVNVAKPPIDSSIAIWGCGG